MYLHVLAHISHNMIVYISYTCVGYVRSAGARCRHFDPLVRVHNPNSAGSTFPAVVGSLL